MDRPIGTICREWREKEGYQLADIADVANISVSQVSRFERGLTVNNGILHVYVMLGCPLTRRDLIRYIGGDATGGKAEK